TRGGARRARQGAAGGASCDAPPHATRAPPSDAWRRPACDAVPDAHQPWAGGAAPGAACARSTASKPQRPRNNAALGDAFAAVVDAAWGWASASGSVVASRSAGVSASLSAWAGAAAAASAVAVAVAVAWG